ncbi:GGDEF domain-containing protein [Aerophototrophica crusticola]|uniref:diguanylate cyclase n=1 Tax=Aerophototrophica crusticola TaxID=1709002 RepID=A0A858R3Q1_9PROT|nr:GGDEF domain-containing protein [Rhodospirillaceae bacterium B3]
MQLFIQTIDQASRIAHRAMDRMREENIPPSPENYTVWYAYYSGNYPDLVRAVDILASNNQTFTEQHCVDLYRQFFANDAEVEAVRDAGQKLHASVTEVLSALKGAGADVDRYGHTLQAAGDALGIARTLEQLKSLVQTMASETELMAARNKSLQSELTSSADKIESMRRDLDSVRREALTDGLTGIANRKRFDQTLRDAAVGAMERGQPLVLLMVDIDHFKRFNDTHGHVAGDNVLKLVARTLTEQVKGKDTPCRYGGEEFAIVLPETRLEDALTLAEQIRNAVASRKIVKRTTGESMGTITLSVGAARYRPGEPLTKLVQRADAALYAAKTGGRNRVLADADDVAEKVG